MNRFGLPVLGLHVPRELAAADLAGLRTRASEHLTDAAQVREQAVALRRAVVRLVPAAWLGLGALGFAGTALVQAGTLEAVAAALEELGQGLADLAVALEQARAEAADAVRLAARVEDEVAAAEAQRARRPPPEQWPEQWPELDGAWLGARTDAARRAQARLAGALEDARRAWGRAGATFDRVAYRMPDLAARMGGTTADGWHPSSGLAAVPAGVWRALVGPSPVCSGAGWTGGGTVTGPDDRAYPLVVPWLEREGRRTTADGPAPAESGRTASLGGADPGWQPVGLRLGIDEFGAPARAVDKAAVVLAGLAGGTAHAVDRLRPELLTRLEVAPDGTARLAPADSPNPTVRAGTTSVPRSALVPGEGESLRWVPDTSRDPALGTRGGRRSTADAPPLGRSTPAGANVLGLVDTGLAGAATARGMDATRSAAYRVLFEENADGRRRARLTLYQVADDGTGPRVVAADATVDPTGTLRREPVVPAG